MAASSFLLLISCVYLTDFAEDRFAVKIRYVTLISQAFCIRDYVQFVGTFAVRRNTLILIEDLQSWNLLRKSMRVISSPASLLLQVYCT